MRSQYLKYAIGEIFLVVIGILIALALNNWSNLQDQKAKEQVLLNGLKRDLINQLSEAKTHENRELTYVTASKTLIEGYNETGRFKVDKPFTKLIGSLVNRRTFIKTDPTYAELVTSGTLDLIRDVELKGQIVEYYQFLARVESILQNNNSNYVDDKFRSGIYELSKFSMIETIKAALNPDNLDGDDSLIKGLIETERPELYELTEQKINSPDHILWFTNLLQFRNLQATIHAFYMVQIKQRTQDVLISLEESIE